MSALFSTTTPPPPSGPTINIAVAGLGRMGKRHVLTLATRVPRANVVAVCSASQEEVEWAREAYKAFVRLDVFDTFQNPS